jgi:putative hemolysin
VLELVIAVVLICLNGIFALSELAVVSSREVRLRTMAAAGYRGAAAALDLTRNPGRFLSTVQIGITLVGILAGAVSGAALGRDLSGWLASLGMRGTIADPLGYTVVIAIVTYLSVIIGELVPKQLALRDPERIACLVARPMRFLSRIAGPAVGLLDASSRAVFRMLGKDTAPPSAVTEEEVRTIVAEAESAGIIETAERSMIAGVLRLGDRSVRAVMTPRGDVEWIDLADDEDEIRKTLMEARYSLLPVMDGEPDNVIGVVWVRDVLVDLLEGRRLDVRAHLHPPPIVPDTVDALDALTALRNADVPIALVHDEYGHFEGIVTPFDTLIAIAGGFRADDDEAEGDAVRREDGSWLLAGGMAADEMAELLGIRLPADRDYETVAGFVIDRFAHLPQTGESVEALGWRFEVVDLDNRRVDKVLAMRSESES